MQYKCFLALLKNIHKYSDFVTANKYAYQKFLLTFGNCSVEILDKELEHLSSPFAISSTENWVENMLDAKAFPRERASISEDMLSLLITNFYPNLFFDEKTTLEFFKDFKRTKYYNALSAEEKMSIYDLSEDIRSEFYDFDGVVVTYEHGGKTPEEENMLNIIERVSENITSTITIIRQLDLTDKYGLYREQLIGFVNFSFSKLNQHKDQALSVIALQAINEFTKGCLISIKNNEFEQLLIYCQIISQVVQLIVDHYPPIHSILEELNDSSLFKERPAASFLAANKYSLFTKLAVIPTSEPKKIFSLDDSFDDDFKKILSDTYLLENKGHAGELPKEADLIFTRIESPNSDKCTINILIESLRKNELNFPLTVIVDVSRVALKDDLVNTLLDKTKPLRDNGDLNLVLIQAQSHFWQLCLNKGKGNLLAVFNNDNQRWKEFNTSINKLSIYNSISPGDAEYYLLMNASLLCSKCVELLENSLDVTYAKATQIAQSLHIPKRSILLDHFCCSLDVCLKESVEEKALSKNLCSLLANDGLKFIWGRVIGNPLLALHVTSGKITINPGLVTPSVDELKIACALTTSFTSMVNEEMKAKWAKIEKRESNEKQR
jgi:hypothetical protein